MEADEVTIVSLCTGYGGLEMGLALAGIRGRLLMVADPSPAASKLLAARYPGVPNLGDITTVDWATLARVNRVDIILAGYPCQGESLAGQRKGTADERWIWPHIADSIRHFRPRHVFLENVPGHRSMGFGRVLADLAALGYVGSWRSIRASDVGAPHRRERLFIYAYPPGNAPGDAGAAQLRKLQGAPARSRAATLLPTPAARLGISTSLTPQAAANRQATRAGKGLNLDDVIALLPSPETACEAGAEGGGGMPVLPTPTAMDGNRATVHYPDQHTTLNDAVAQLLPTPAATRYGSNQPLTSGAAVCPGLDSIDRLLPTPRASANENRSTRVTPSQEQGRHGRYLSSELCTVQPGRWGPYQAAVARWEAVTGNRAPEPTEPGISTAVRLAPAFPEWMMGLPAGWVTAVAGLTRNEQLQLVGNGVMPPQFAYAVKVLAAARWGKRR